MDMTTETLIKLRRQILAFLNTIEEELKFRGELDITSKELREYHKELREYHKRLTRAESP